MTTERRSFWNSDRRAAYLVEVAEKADASRRRKHGEDVAARLQDIWPLLGAQDKAILDALLLANRQSFVAPHGAPLLRNLVAKGLLRYPRGVGGSWMRNLRTTYIVAPAVWQELRIRRDELLSDRNESIERRLEQTHLSIRHLLEI